MKKSKQLLSDGLTHSNLAVNIFCGCDITSSSHSVRSRTLSQKSWENQEFRNLLRTFFISIRQKRHIASWRENSTSSARWQEGENS